METIELHSVGDISINKATKIIDVLIRYKYVKITKIKTKLVKNGRQSFPKLVTVLSKTPEFDEQYDKFIVDKLQKIAIHHRESQDQQQTESQKCENSKQKEEEKSTENLPKSQNHEADFNV